MFASGKAIMRSYIMFKPHMIFTTLGTFFLVIGLIPFIRFLIFFFQGTGGGHLQSLIFGSSMLVGALLSFALLVISDLQRTNRILLEEQLERTKETLYK